MGDGSVPAIIQMSPASFLIPRKGMQSGIIRNIYKVNFYMVDF